uniref:Uncharacterized protein n=1 Tax=Ditylenchus dipsaci TaxID=166011 RepID=A0A915DYC0_9BILA
MLEQTNHSTIARFVVDGLRDILSSGARRIGFCCCYGCRKIYGKSCKRSFICSILKYDSPDVLCHALHRVAEQIRFLFPDVDNLTSNVKKMINKLDEEDAISIKLSQQAFASLETSQMLAYIHSYFAVIPSAIGNLESEGMELTASLRIFLEVKSAVKKAPGEIGRKSREKV